jgi:hypothetical protein
LVALYEHSAASGWGLRSRCAELCCLCGAFLLHCTAFSPVNARPSTMMTPGPHWRQVPCGHAGRGRPRAEPSRRQARGVGQPAGLQGDCCWARRATAAGLCARRSGLQPSGRVGAPLWLKGACPAPSSSERPATTRFEAVAGSCDAPSRPQVVVHAVSDGACLGSFSAYDDALGAKAAAWGPGGDVLAVGSYDQVGEGPVTRLPCRERGACSSPGRFLEGPAQRSRPPHCACREADEWRH